MKIRKTISRPKEGEITFQHMSNAYIKIDADDLTEENTPNVYEFKSYQERFEHIVIQIMAGADKCQMLVSFPDDGQNTVFICRQSPNQSIKYLKNFLFRDSFISLWEADHDDADEMMEMISGMVYS